MKIITTAIRIITVVSSLYIAACSQTNLKDEPSSMAEAQPQPVAQAVARLAVYGKIDAVNLCWKDSCEKFSVASAGSGPAIIQQSFDVGSRIAIGSIFSGETSQLRYSRPINLTEQGSYFLGMTVENEGEITLSQSADGPMLWQVHHQTQPDEPLHQYAPTNFIWPENLSISSAIHFFRKTQQYELFETWIDKYKDSGDAQAYLWNARKHSSKLKHKYQTIDLKKAITYYNHAANAGSADAMYELGRLLMQYRKPTKQLQRKVINWYEKAAVAGSPQATSLLCDVADNLIHDLAWCGHGMSLQESGKPIAALLSKKYHAHLKQMNEKQSKQLESRVAELHLHYLTRSPAISVNVDIVQLDERIASSSDGEMLALELRSQ